MTASYLVLFFVVVWTICGIAGSLIWQRKGGSALSRFLIGFVLGVFGIAFIAIANPGGRRPCPYCREPMRVDATVCPHCHRDVEPMPRVEPSLIGQRVEGSTLGLPEPWARSGVEESSDRNWWRPGPWEGMAQVSICGPVRQPLGWHAVGARQTPTR